MTDTPTLRLPLDPSNRAEPLLPHIPRFRVLERLAQGGMSDVWLARCRRGRKLCAIKTPKRGMEERHRLEIRAMTCVRHRNIVRVVDADPLAAVPWYAMPFYERGSLRDLISTRGPLDPLRAVIRLLGPVRALAAIHGRRVVHRDLKPENILVADDGKLLLSDFGLVRFLAERSELTTVGCVMGTRVYMAREQAEGRNDLIDVRTDLPAVGRVLLEMIAGSPRRVPDFLQDILGRCLAEDLAERYPDAAALAADLEAFVRS